MKFGYDDILHDKKFLLKQEITGPIVILTPRSQQRIFAQKSVFSLHDVSFMPIQEMYKACVKKYEIPIKSIGKAKQFLFLSGMNEYSLFPDLDGLGRFLNSRHKIRYKT